MSKLMAVISPVSHEPPEIFYLFIFYYERSDQSWQEAKCGGGGGVSGKVVKSRF